MGVIAKAHGLRGDVLVVSHHADSTLWAPGVVLALIAPERVPATPRDRIVVEPSRIATVKRARRVPGGHWTLQLDCALDRDAAEALRGYHLAVEPSRLPAPDPDEVYHHELPGWSVVDVSGAAVGTVTGVFAGPGGDLIDVDLGDGVQVYVPFVAAIVKEIDRSARRLVIDPPEGLLEP